MTQPDEPDVRDLLSTALRGEPASTLDLALPVKLGRRRLRLQRTGATLGAVVIAGGVALGAGLLRHHNDGTAPDHISAAAPVRATPSTSQVAVAPAQDIIDKQNAAFRQAYAASSGMSPVTGVLSLTPTQPIDLGYAGGQLIVRLGDRGGTGDFSLTTGVADGPIETTCESTTIGCAIQQIDGVTVEIQTDHPTAKTTRIFTVALSPSGKVLVNGVVDNIASMKSTALTRSTPPLTADQLALITAVVASVSP